MQGFWGPFVHRRYLKLAVLLALLAVGEATNVLAEQKIQLPLSCAVHSSSGRLVARPGPPTTYDLVTRPEQRTVTVCGSDGCRPVMLYRFDVACDDEQVSWVHLAAALVNESGGRAVISNGRMIMRSFGWVAPGGECAAGLLATRGPGDQAERRFERHCRRASTRVLPKGFAPVFELGARLIETPAVTAEMRGTEASERLSAIARARTAHAANPGRDVQHAARSAARERLASDEETFAPVRGDGNPHISAAERWADPPPLKFPERASAQRPAQQKPPPSPESAPEDHPVVADLPAPSEDKSEPEATELPTDVEPPPVTVEAASSPLPPPENEQEEPAGDSLKLVSTAGWSSSVTPAERQTEPSDLQLLNAFSIFTGQMRDLHIERDFAILLVGLTLLSGLVSGAGWYATRARRVPVAAPIDLQVPESRAMVYRPPPETALLAPADKVMCSELCKTAHTLLRQIETNVDSLQGVAPLRRVLQREMRHLEQFLTAVMTAAPAEAEEWRRMRNRLQRIVKELHRLKDIVDGAYRSLSGGGFSGREPPRDKNEAFEMLGVHADISPKTLKKLVDALRACWHPDLAKDEPDRVMREERMKRINIAWDLLSEKRQEA